MAYHHILQQEHTHQTKLQADLEARKEHADASSQRRAQLFLGQDTQATLSAAEHARERKARTVNEPRLILHDGGHGRQPHGQNARRCRNCGYYVPAS
jgi:hypothetical protein